MNNMIDIEESIERTLLEMSMEDLVDNDSMLCYAELHSVEVMEEFDLCVDYVVSGASNDYLDELLASIEKLQAYLITQNMDPNILKYLEMKYDQIDDLKEISINIGMELNMFKKKLAKHIIEKSKDQDEIYMMKTFVTD